MTHAQLVLRACGWLRKSERCCVVMREASHLMLREIPDAIGWRSEVYRSAWGEECVRIVSTVVECKVSRSDVLANRRKPPQTMGRYRYLLTLPGLASEADLPDGWGLLILEAGGVRRVSAAGWNWSHDTADEQVLLVAEMRRVGLKYRSNGLVLEE